MEGFVYGFVVILECVEVEYKCMVYYDLIDEIVIVWNDFVIGVDWFVVELMFLFCDVEVLIFVEIMLSLVFV